MSVASIGNERRDKYENSTDEGIINSEKYNSNLPLSRSIRGNRVSLGEVRSCVKLDTRIPCKFDST